MHNRSTHFVAVIAAIAVLGAPAASTASTDAGVVGNGTPASCNETAFNTALSGGGTVTFNCGSAVTIVLSGSKQINTNTVIDGGGTVTLDGNPGAYFQVFSGQSLTLRRITLSGFSTSGTGAVQNFGDLFLDRATLANNQTTGDGAAVQNYGIVTATNSVFDGNTASADGGAIINEGGRVTLLQSSVTNNRASIASGHGGGLRNNSGFMQVQNTYFSGNRALDGGAAHVLTGTLQMIASTLYSNTAGYGGAIESTGVLTVVDSLIDSNYAANTGGGLWLLSGKTYLLRTTVSNNRSIDGAGLSNYSSFPSSTFLRDVTFSGNAATGHGGGIYNSGTLTLLNVTLSGNSAGPGKGGGGVYANGGLMALNFVTVSGNSGTFAGGIYNETIGGGTLNVRASLLSGNTGGNCGGVITSLGYNVSNDTYCSVFTQTGDANNVTAAVGALTNNGGGMRTHMPVAGNPAINRIPLASCSMVDATSPADQRGAARPVAALCDSGAVESGAVVPMVRLPLVTR